MKRAFFEKMDLADQKLDVEIMRLDYRGISIELKQGDLSQEKADALVNAANSALAGGGGVDGALHRTGGPSIMEETRLRYPQGCETGSAVPSSAGQLNASFIFHAVAPRYTEKTKETAATQLASAYKQSLQLALEKGCVSIAFPSLGTGAYHYPLSEAAAIALNSVKEVIDSLTESNRPSLKEIRFILFDRETLEHFTKRMCQIFPFPWTRQETATNAAADYADIAEVRRYDERMGTIRNVSEENADLLSLLQLPCSSPVLEIGTGTGAFARDAARSGLSVTAADISSVMLQYAQTRAQEEGLPEIRFVHGGFLSLNFPDSSFNAVVSSLALHHLSDVWKAEAVSRIHRWLKPNGLFLLVDVVFQCEGGDLNTYLLREIPDSLPDVMKYPFYTHIRDEFSTFHWVMAGILERAGFKILRCEKFKSLPHLYLCQRGE